MSESHTVTLICCSYNREAALRATLSNKLQVRGVGQILVVLDGSTDGSVVFLKEERLKDSRLTILTLPHGGLQAARNAGISAAEGNWLLMVDDDDLCPPDYLEKLQATAAKFDAMVVGAPWFNAGSGPVADLVQKGKSHPLGRLSLRSHPSAMTAEDVLTPYIPQAILIHRDVASAFPYDSGYGGNSWREETDVFVRVAAAGIPIARSVGTYSWLAQRYGGGIDKSSSLRYEYWVFVNEIRFLRRNTAILRQLEVGWLGWPLETVKTVAPRLFRLARTTIRGYLARANRRFFGGSGKKSILEP